MSQALTISAVSYSVAGLDILKQLSLDVEEQQYYAIAGINGAGNLFGPVGLLHPHHRSYVGNRSSQGFKPDKIRPPHHRRGDQLSFDSFAPGEW